jgi:transcriptional regulator with XRE-family HTH domain
VRYHRNGTTAVKARPARDGVPHPAGRPVSALDRAVEVRDVVETLRALGLTQESIAQASGVSVKSVQNWVRTSAIRPTHEDRLRVLREIAIILQDTLTARGVGQWFRAPNRLLKGRRPIEDLAAGHVEAVRNAARAYIEGSYV